MFFDDPVVKSFLFYPRKIKEPEKLKSDEKILKFEVEDGIILGGIIYIKDKNLPTILLFHGNAELSTDYRLSTEPFYEIGVNLAVMDYRGYGFSSGSPSFPALISDALPIYLQFIEWIKDNGFKNSIFVMGRSLGSVCASEIGSHNPDDLKGIIFESGFANLHDTAARWLNVKELKEGREAISKYSNDTRIKKFKKPVLVIHGSNDFVILCEQGKLIYECVPEGVNKELVIIDGAGHNDIIYYKDEYFNPLKKFIEKYK